MEMELCMGKKRRVEMRMATTLQIIRTRNHNTAILNNDCCKVGGEMHVTVLGTVVRIDGHLKYSMSHSRNLYSDCRQ
jgi:hypothetical protein